MKMLLQLSLSRFTGAGLLCAIFIANLIFGTDTSAAESKKKANPPAQVAWLRIWSGNLSDNRALRVSVRSSNRKSSASDRADNLGKYRFGDYAAAPAGALTVEILDTKNEKTPLATVLAQVAAESFWTLLVREVGGEIRAEMIDDTPSESGAVALTVRNFAPSLSSLQIDVGPDFHVKLVSPDSFIHVCGLAAERLQVETSGAEISGNVLQWTNAVDFSKYRGATVLIYPDPYGRIRPRVVVTGQVFAPDEATGEVPQPRK